MDFNNKKMKIAIGTLISIVVLIGIFIMVQVGPYDRNDKEDLVVEIPAGSSIDTIGEILYENELIKNKTLFKLTVKISNKAPQIKAGKYSLNRTYSNNDIIDLLVSGKIFNDGIKVTIPEGYTYKETIDIIVKAGLGKEEVFEELINSPDEFYESFKFLDQEDITTLEGFLYPDTYYFDEELTEKEIINTMLKRFQSELTDDLLSRIKDMDMTLQEIVSLASIVEKEAVKDIDRPIIASVFYNRLDIEMPLQSDATIQYIFEERKKIVTYADLKIDSPYNSYKYKGLPPTPIANPSIKSIEAVLYPEDTDYLYFVATMDGGNNYSETYEQHLKYVEEYKEERDKLQNK